MDAEKSQTEKQASIATKRKIGKPRGGHSASLKEEYSGREPTIKKIKSTKDELRSTFLENEAAKDTEESPSKTTSKGKRSPRQLVREKSAEKSSKETSRSAFLDNEAVKPISRDKDSSHQQLEEKTAKQTSKDVGSSRGQVEEKSTEVISLKGLLSDVIELEETPFGLVIPKGNPDKEKTLEMKQSSDVISFRTLISDVVDIEETPYGMVIPKEKFNVNVESLNVNHLSPISGSVSKRRNTFTLEKKISMLDELDSGVRLTEVAKKYRVATSTLSTMYKDRVRLRSAGIIGGMERKRIRGGQYQKVDEAVLEWYRAASKDGQWPNGPQIQEKARELAQEIGERNFEGSAGWLKCFKDRFGISKGRKSLSSESCELEKERHLLQVGLARANVCLRNQMAKRTGKDKDDDGLEIRNSAMTQDLKSKGGGLRRVDTVGDLVEVRYIARVLDDAVLHGEVIDSNEKDDHPLCLKVKEWWKSWKDEESGMDTADGEERRWWEGALWGATVGTRRMIVLPPDIVCRMKGLKVKLSPEACLVYEVEILQIRRGIGVEEVKLGQTAGDTSKQVKVAMANAREQEGTPRKGGHMAGCSLAAAVTCTPSGSPPIGVSTLKDTRTPADKASILSRMARMGQPTLMLPDLQARRRAASEGDDGSGKAPTRGDEREDDVQADEEVELEDGGYILPMEVAYEVEPMPISSGSRPPPPRLQPRPIGVPQVQPPYQSSVYWHSPPQYSNVPQASSYSLPSRPESTLLGHPQQHQQYPYSSHTLALTGPTTVPNQPAFQDPHLSVFLSETRTQNAELRMAMGRLTDKVDAIMSKMDRSPVQQQQPQEQQQSAEMRAVFEREREEWKEKEEQFEMEMTEAKSKLNAKVAATEDRCKMLERENTCLKKELEETCAKLQAMQNNRTAEISEALKSAMNSVYSHLQPEFSNGVAYEGLVVRKTLAAMIREVTLKFLSSNSEEKDESEVHKGGTLKEVHTIRRKSNKPEIKAKPDGRKVFLRKGSSPKIDVDVSSSAAHHLDSDKNVGNGSANYKDSSKHADEERLELKSSSRDSSQMRIKEEPRSRCSSREGSLERVINPEPPSPPIFDAGELSESGEEWMP